MANQEMKRLIDRKLLKSPGINGKLIREWGFNDLCDLYLSNQ